VEDEVARRKKAKASSQKWRAQYELYVMRHGEAVAREDEGYADDSTRPLTLEGRKELQRIAKGLRRLGVSVDWVVSSPLVRSVETAQIIAELAAPGVPPELSETLSPGGSAEALLTFLAKHPSRTHTILVGHEPDLSELAARLIGADRHANFALRKGGVCLLTFAEFPPRSAGRLMWWMTPRILRKLA
jgi:phosphohistidine phosphatase